MIYDVVIAGAGPVGLFLACELRLAGLSVLVLEQVEDPRSPDYVASDLKDRLGLSAVLVRPDALHRLDRRSNARSCGSGAGSVAMVRRPQGAVIFE